MQAQAAFGPLWESNWHKSMALQSAHAGDPYSNVVAYRGDNVRSSASVEGFDSCGGGAGGGKSSMVYIPTVERGQKINYSLGVGELLDADALIEERYNADGGVNSVNFARGDKFSYTYSDASTPTSISPSSGLLIQVSDQYGRDVRFSYEQPVDPNLQPRITRVTEPNGHTIVAAYDANNNLASLTWADGQVQSFVYEQMALPWALTGLVDENTKRHATYGYDSQGRAISTSLAGGVDKYTVSYPGGQAAAWNVTQTVIGDVICREHRWIPPIGTTVLLPTGQSSSMDASVPQGMVGVTRQSQPAGSGCAASTSNQGYDANGNVSQRDDFNGTRSCYANDLNRNLETSRVEGLSTTAVCSAVTASNAALPVNSRKVSTQWHPDWRLSTKLAEPGRITTSIYNGQPDPFNANAVASCAPSTALLPDGKPIVVLCKQVEQATTDVDGHLGFTAALQSAVPARATTWTYNQWGQVLTENGPRTDVNDVTAYAYYPSTSFTGTDPNAEGHTMGDLQTITNAAGKVTTYSKYNKRGQVLQSSDPNGVITVNEYWPRGWLKSTTIAGQKTSYDYDPVGQLKKVTLPDASWIGYDYDDAHRQTAVYDHNGNRTTYVLDNAGHKTGETTKDPGGALKRQLSRSIDALGRVQQTTGRE